MNEDFKLKSIKLPKYDRIPRWLILQGEIDCRLYILKQMSSGHSQRTPIERMVDVTTGYSDTLLAEAKELMAELRWLKAEYDKEVEQTNKQETGHES